MAGEFNGGFDSHWPDKINQNLLCDLFFMDYTDRIYGKQKISEPVILEILESPTFQRLKGVDQFGYLSVYFPGTAHDRFEHSVGVFLLLRKYGAPFEEQIAGLIHDVSHAVFSHCIDYVLCVDSGEKQEHQDNIFEKFVKNSDIPDILRKHGLDIDYILNDKNFPLKEKKLPDLCADRIDYILRDSLVFGESDQKGVEYFLNHLFVENNVWFFDDFLSAKNFAELFLKLNNKYYCGLAAAKMFASVSSCLKYALEKGYLEEGDLFTTDDVVIAKVKNHLGRDEKLKLSFERMDNRISSANNPADYDQRVLCKSRVVDPFFRDGEKLKRVSEVDAAWAAALPEELKPKEYFIKFEK
jgi:HD superfamily phosphohydrolase